MIFQPVLPVVFLVVVAVLLLGFTGWRVVDERRDRRMALTWVRRLVVVALLLVVAVRPSVPGGTSEASVAELNVFFVVDTTSSVAAEDWNGDRPRLDGVRADIGTITDDLAGARFSLVTFDSTAVQRVPLTDDSSAVVSAADTMRQEVTYYSHGSSITEPRSLLGQLLKSAHTSDPKRANVVFYMGDGEQTSGATPASMASLRSDVDGGGVLGYGTSAGGRMRVFDGYGDQYSTKGYIKDKTQPGSPDAISKIDETTLRAMAAQLGVPFEHRSEGASLASVVDPAEHGHVVSSAGRTASLTDLYWIFAIPLFLLLFVDLGLIARAIGDVRSPRGASDARSPRGTGSRGRAGRGTS